MNHYRLGIFHDYESSVSIRVHFYIIITDFGRIMRLFFKLILQLPYVRSIQQGK